VGLRGRPLTTERRQSTKPHLRFLSDDVINQITDEGLALLIDPGVRVENAEALDLLASAGADVDFEAQVAHIPEDIVRTALETAPSDFDLYDLDGEPVVHHCADSVQFTGLKAQYERRDQRVTSAGQQEHGDCKEAQQENKGRTLPNVAKAKSQVVPEAWPGPGITGSHGSGDIGLAEMLDELCEYELEHVHAIQQWRGVRG